MSKKFKVLFINPNLMLQTTFSMGIALLASILKENNIDVEVFDTTFYKVEDFTSDEARVENLQIAKFTLSDEYKNLPTQNDMFGDLEKKIKSYEPDLIAYSIIEDVYNIALNLINITKEFKIPTIAGGIFPTFAPQRVINVDGIDIVCVGEGEEAILELCNSMIKNKSYSNIKNLIIKKGNQNIINEVRSLRKLDKNPSPDFSVFDKRRFLKPMKGKVYKMGVVETHRGCPYSCRFCNSYSLNKFYREKTGEKFFRSKNISDIYKDISKLINEYNVEYLYFPSEVIFAGGKDYIEEFVDMYKKVKLPFFCQNRAEFVDEENIKYLQEMNCHSMALGIEHGNEKFRKNVLKRNVSNDTYINAVKIMEKTNIKVSVNNIIGFPDETRELAFDTIMLNRSFNVYQINAYFFTPYHGTALHDYCVNKRYIDENIIMSCVTKETLLNMPQPFLSKQEVHGLVRTFNLYARFPEERFSEIKIAENFTLEGNQMFNKLKNEYWSKYLLH